MGKRASGVGETISYLTQDISKALAGSKKMKFFLIAPSFYLSVK
jgi:hypothetical protein